MGSINDKIYRFTRSSLSSSSHLVKFQQNIDAKRWTNSDKQRLKFTKFKLQIIEFLTKFSLQLDKIWFKTFS